MNPMDDLKKEIASMTKPVVSLRDAVARAIFYSGFHPDDVANGNAAKKWDEWPDEQVRQFKKADAALAAYRAHDEAHMAVRFGPKWREKLNSALKNMERL
jgi:thymidylate synthase